jgi:hypothetical protein
MRQIEAEDRLFHRFGFGSEVHDIQLTALRAEKRDLLAQVESMQMQIGVGPSRRGGLRSWLILPAALGAVVFQAIHPRRQRRPSRPSMPISPEPQMRVIDDPIHA